MRAARGDPSAGHQTRDSAGRREAGTAARPATRAATDPACRRAEVREHAGRPFPMSRSESTGDAVDEFDPSVFNRAVQAPVK